MIFEPFDLHCAAPLYELVIFVLDDGVVNTKERLAISFKAFVLLKG